MNDTDHAGDDLLRALRDPFVKCECDFCAGRKSYADNWCPRCAETRMLIPKWWENLDVCDECEAQMNSTVDERSE